MTFEAWDSGIALWDREGKGLVAGWCRLVACRTDRREVYLKARQRSGNRPSVTIELKRTSESVRCAFKYPIHTQLLVAETAATVFN